MYIDIGAPATQLLGIAQLEIEEEFRPVWLGITLQHPPVHLSGQAHRNLVIEGARAHVARAYGKRFLATRGLPLSGELQIELSIPAQIGLGSEPILGLSAAQALAWMHDQEHEETESLAQAIGLEAHQALQYHGYRQGGLMILDLSPRAGEMPPLVWRTDLSHNDKETWVFVYVFPRLPEDTPEDLEEQQRRKLLELTARCAADTGNILETAVLPAVKADNLEGFAASLSRLQDTNQQSLRQSGAWLEGTEGGQHALAIMEEFGVMVSGRMLTGLGVYGLVRGAKTSRELRAALSKGLGPFGGNPIATICENGGANFIVKEQDLHLGRFQPIRLRPGMERDKS